MARHYTLQRVNGFLNADGRGFHVDYSVSDDGNYSYGTLTFFRDKQTCRWTVLDDGDLTLSPKAIAKEVFDAFLEQCSNDTPDGMSDDDMFLQKQLIPDLGDEEV